MVLYHGTNTYTSTNAKKMKARHMFFNGWCVYACSGGTKVQWRSSHYGENRNDVHHQLSAGVQNKGMGVAIKCTRNTHM